jgi:subtilisin-like proprotein convertase family protein
MTNTDEFYYRVCDNGIPALCNDAKVNVAIDFGTDALACSSPNVDIPDNDAIIGVIDTLTMMQSGLITDLEVGLEINHTYVGDLTVKLVHASSGTEVILINRGACAEKNISAILDDDESLLVDAQCGSPMAINGRFKPSGSLSSFNNLELSGNWNLNVIDSAALDTGALISWCLDPVFTSSPPVLDFIADLSVNETENISFFVTATDADTTQPNLNFSLSGEPTGASMSESGIFDFTPTEEQGGDAFSIFKNYTFDVIVSDDSNPPLTDTQSLTVTVNEVNSAPVLSLIGNKSVDALDTLLFTAMALDTDLPAHTLSFSLVGAPMGASINANGEFSFTPTIAQDNNSYSFDVVVSDDQFPALTDSENITVTVGNNMEIIFKSGFE